MPFKIKLKKSRQYNVTSKKSGDYVISVFQLLDTSTAVDCTLSCESTGQECLDNVCQRLSINQPEFFGLRYIIKGSEDELRWIDLERPLNRQLDKYAANTKLYLRIMYYVLSGVSLITDEVTRYYYFLQLKSDVVEGRINCDSKQAVILAIYCRQAEYENHQSDKHTVDYLKTLLPFPKHMIEAGLLEPLTEEVLQQNAELHNLTQSAAEELYIATCQQIDGYGQEKFTAKDDIGSEVNLGTTISGIAVVSDTLKFYPWRDISNVVNHKKTFNIECTVPDRSVGFSLPDAETGRYFWKLCVLQHTFFMKYEQNQIHSSHINLSLFQNIPENLNDSRDNLLVDQQGNNWRASDQQISNSNWTNSESSVLASNLTLASLQQSNQQLESSWPTVPVEYSNQSNRNSNWGLAPAGSNASLNNRAQSSSCLDLSNNNINQESEIRKALLPIYRPAPDYETALQQKYRPSSSDLRLNAPPAAIIQVPSGMVSDPHINMYKSHPDVHRATNDQFFGHQIPTHYPDVTQTTNPIYAQQQIDPSFYGVDGVSQKFRLMRLAKQPPPYPANRLSSTSTPDLALASQRALLGYRGTNVSGSSPDLVSTRNRHNYMQQQINNPMFHNQSTAGVGGGTVRLRHSQSYLPHGTYENLNFVEPTKTNLLSKQIQKVYDGKNVIYCMPRDVEHQILLQQDHQYQNGGMIQSLVNSSSQHINGSIEPIYENVPLPWPNNENNSSEMRDRTSSVQSAPGVMRIGDKINKGSQQIYNEEYPTVAAVNVTKINNYNPQPEFSQVQTDLPSQSHEENSHRIVVKTSSNPILNNSMNSMKLNHEVEIKNQINNSSHMESMNRSSSTTILDSSQSSSLTTNTTDSGISSGSKEKRKKRWGILSRTKLGSGSSDKQKSATLGREKDKKKKNGLTKEEESNLRHRWSTGIPRLPPLPSDISKEKLCSLLEAKLNDNELFLEFERIPRRKENARFDCALNDENKSKNFDPNFLPYDDNRVRLTPTMDNKLGYVNASLLSATVGAKQRFYIVAQSPRDSITTNIFWQCVWESDVYLLVQLSDEVKYVPPTSERYLEYGQYQVWREFSQETERCITSKLRIYHTQSRRYRSVWHLNFSDWNEQNCPRSVPHFLDFLEELRSVRLASIGEIPPGHNTNPPVFIHCGEGGGRAGIALASDLLLYILDNNQGLDIPGAVKKLREQRDNIIPSLAQYKFVYALLIHYLKQNRLI